MKNIQKLYAQKAMKSDQNYWFFQPLNTQKHFAADAQLYQLSIIMV